MVGKPQSCTESLLMDILFAIITDIVQIAMGIMKLKIVLVQEWVIAACFFYDGSGTYLHVITHGGGPPDAIIDGWGEASAEDVVQRRVNNHSFLPPDAPPATTPQPAVTANYASRDTTSNKNNDADTRTKDSSG